MCPHYQGDKDKEFDVWVQDLRSNEPKEYLTVKTQNNYSTIVSDRSYYRGGDMKTYYDRVRIDPITLEIDINDTTYSNTQGGPIKHYANGKYKETWDYCQYGVTKNCNSSKDNNKSMAMVDLTGTPFYVINNWEIGGTRGKNVGYARFSSDGQIVVIKAANGTSGFAKPENNKIKLAFCEIY